ncbi:MAG: ABC transporter permease [Myxococcota bacterium]
MKTVWAVCQREVFSFFVSPIAYVVLTVWLFFQGLSLYIFSTHFATNQYGMGGASQTPLTMFFGASSLFYMVLLVVVPLLTMRLVAHERATGTLEALLTAPVKVRDVVLGKYFAALIFWVALWLPSLLYVWILSNFGEIDWGVVGASYLGVFSFGSYYMALGLLMSALSRTQIVAATLTFFVIATLFLLGVAAFVLEGTASDIFGYVSVWSHMEDFSKGIIDSRYLIFDFTVAILGVVLTILTLSARRRQV